MAEIFKDCSITDLVQFETAKVKMKASKFLYPLDWPKENENLAVYGKGFLDMVSRHFQQPLEIVDYDQQAAQHKWIDLKAFSQWHMQNWDMHTFGAIDWVLVSKFDPRKSMEKWWFRGQPELMTNFCYSIILQPVSINIFINKILCSFWFKK